MNPSIRHRRTHSRAIALTIGVLLWMTAILAPTTALSQLTDHDIATLNETSAQVVEVDGEADPPGLAALIGRLVLSLGVVLALMAGVLWLARRYLPQAGKGKRGQSIEILASRSVGPRKNLLLVRVRDRTVLLGVTAQQIRMLTEMDNESLDWREAATASGIEAPTLGTTGLGGA